MIFSSEIYQQIAQISPMKIVFLQQGLTNAWHVRKIFYLP